MKLAFFLCISVICGGFFTTGECFSILRDYSGTISVRISEETGNHTFVVNVANCDRIGFTISTIEGGQLFVYDGLSVDSGEISFQERTYIYTTNSTMTLSYLKQSLKDRFEGIYGCVDSFTGTSIAVLDRPAGIIGDGPGPYTSDVDRTWYVRPLNITGVGNGLELKILEFELESVWDDVIISSNETVIAHLTGSHSPQKMLVHVLEVDVRFRSDSSNQKEGFLMSYNIVERATVFNVSVNQACYNLYEDTVEVSYESPIVPGTLTISLIDLANPDDILVLMSNRVENSGLYLWDTALLTSYLPDGANYAIRIDTLEADLYGISEPFTLLSFCTLGTRIEGPLSGIISDGSGDVHYRPGSNCSWSLDLSGLGAEVIEFKILDLELGEGDTLSVYDGTSTDSSLLAQITGDEVPDVLTSSNGTMFVSFESKGTALASGFTSVYEGITNYGVPRLRCARNSTYTFSGNSGSFVIDQLPSNGWPCMINLVGSDSFSQIRLFFTEFALPPGYSLDVFDGSLLWYSEHVASYSGVGLPPVTEGNSGTMTLILRSIENVNVTNYGIVSHFSAEVEVPDQCEGLYYVNGGDSVISSGTGLYANDVRCTWIIDVEHVDGYLAFQVLSIDTEFCCDHVEVYGLYSRSMEFPPDPLSIISGTRKEGSALYLIDGAEKKAFAYGAIVFRSDRSKNGKGFSGKVYVAPVEEVACSIDEGAYMFETVDWVNKTLWNQSGSEPALCRWNVQPEVAAGGDFELVINPVLVDLWAESSVSVFASDNRLIARLSRGMDTVKIRVGATTATIIADIGNDSSFSLLYEIEKREVPGHIHYVLILGPAAVAVVATLLLLMRKGWLCFGQRKMVVTGFRDRSLQQAGQGPVARRPAHAFQMTPVSQGHFSRRNLLVA